MALDGDDVDDDDDRDMFCIPLTLTPTIAGNRRERLSRPAIFRVLQRIISLASHTVTSYLPMYVLSRFPKEYNALHPPLCLSPRGPEAHAIARRRSASILPSPGVHSRSPPLRSPSPVPNQPLIHLFQLTAFCWVQLFPNGVFFMAVPVPRSILTLPWCAPLHGCIGSLPSHLVPQQSHRHLHSSNSHSGELPWWCSLHFNVDMPPSSSLLLSTTPGVAGILHTTETVFLSAMPRAVAPTGVPLPSRA